MNVDTGLRAPKFHRSVRGADWAQSAQADHGNSCLKPLHSETHRRASVFRNNGTAIYRCIWHRVVALMRNFAAKPASSSGGNRQCRNLSLQTTTAIKPTAHQRGSSQMRV